MHLPRANGPEIYALYTPDSLVNFIIVSSDKNKQVFIPLTIWEWEVQHRFAEMSSNTAMWRIIFI